MIDYAAVNPADIQEYLEPLAVENFSDDPRKDALALAVDWSVYDTLYKQGRLACVVAKDDGVYIGYIIVLLNNHHHCSKETVGVVDAIYLSPEYRGQGVADDIIATAEEILIDSGAVMMTIGLRNREMADATVGKLGYEPSEVIYSKRLGA